ncbi:hypothetical protein [Gallaecimonas xiamenensis]|uniref:N-methyl-D-aspartate receptor NMDAR2C subunit n=1 Tax=Gallaecimonas xiamenensis 3-C-1 TaxID=745411 RepID=K2K4M5_9GAMM|nr:hypothetical protein [Gallaecimonas xiamenensis]EKE77894.1 hypothetical protein B3C1_00500 [Gallaecimonas xiamenensis 3-C-1]
MDLKSRWLARFPKGEAAFEALVAHYQEPHRHYHNLDHIQDCLALLDEVKDQLDDGDAVELALWFHDVIYDPKAKDNEAQSALWAQYWLTELGEAEDVVAKVAHLVRLTAHPAQPSSADEGYLLDLDLAILGADPQAFDRYQQQIREEYRHVPSLLYKAGRAKVLRSIARAPRLYHSNYFFERREKQARANLAAAIKRGWQ